MPTPSTMRSAIPALALVLSAQNLGTLSSWLRLTSSSWLPMIKTNIVAKPLPIVSTVNIHASEVNWGCVSLGSEFSWFLEHSNRPIDVQRFVPPENVYHKIHGRICKRHNFEMGDWKVFNATRNALHYKPRHLEEDNGLSEPVAFTLVLDFCLCWHCEWLGVTQKITLLQWMEGFIIFFRYALIVVTRLFGAMLEKMEPPHDNKESMRLRPSPI